MAVELQIDARRIGRRQAKTRSTRIMMLIATLSSAEKYQSPNWFETQLTLSLVIGIISFLTFCIARTRSKVLFAPRTLLKGA